MDNKWWELYRDEVKAKRWSAFQGERWTISDPARHRYGLHWIYGRAGPGLSKAPDVLHTGGNSGYAAIGLAEKFGAAKVVLLGYDMQRTGNRSHWHGDHPRRLGGPSRQPYQGWVRRLSVLAADLERAGVEVLNCSRATALTCFTRAPLEVALNGEVRDERREVCAVLA